MLVKPFLFPSFSFCATVCQFLFKGDDGDQEEEEEEERWIDEHLLSPSFVDKRERRGGGGGEGRKTGNAELKPCHTMRTLTPASQPARQPTENYPRYVKVIHIGDTYVLHRYPSLQGICHRSQSFFFLSFMSDKIRRRDDYDDASLVTTTTEPPMKVPLGQALRRRRQAPDLR